MSGCKLCPRECGANRAAGKAGLCGVSALKIARAGLHYGEEPCISGAGGSGAVFFSGCPLRCVFCQNTPISRDCFGKEISRERLAEIFLELVGMGAENIDLVTPTHFSDDIIYALEKVRDRIPVPVIYNCGGYERVETLRRFEGLIDIYMPDFKYAGADIAKKYSAAADYPEKARAALREMYRQCGAAVFDGESGIMKRGLLIRHMVLPGCRHDSMAVLDIIADTVPADKVVLSLLRQYTPCYGALEIKALSRRVTTFEYESVTDYACKLCFNGFSQEKDSATLALTPDWDLTGV